MKRLISIPLILGSIAIGYAYLNPKDSVILSADTKPKWIDNEKYVGIYEGKSYNMMALAKKICLKTNWDEITDEAFEYAKREGENPRKFYGNHYINQHMTEMWNKTEALGKKGKLHGSTGTIRIAGISNRPKSAYGGPKYGITMSISNNPCNDISTLIHELTHVAHLYAYQPHMSGKRERGHDIMFNRIMLMAMKPYFNFSNAQCNPFSMGYSVGCGYAPSRMAQKHLDRVYGVKIPKRLNRFLKDYVAPIVAPPNQDELDKLDKKIMSGFRTTLSSTMRGMNNYDGYQDNMRDFYEIDNGDEYMRNLLGRIKPTMKIDGLSEQDKDILKWWITGLQLQWFEDDDWEGVRSHAAYVKKQDRMDALWEFLNR